jgi:cytochrome P450
VVPFDPADPATREDPYPAYARLRDEDPAHWCPRLRAWLLSRYDDVAAGLRDARLTADHAAAARYKGRPAEALGGSLRTVASDPPAHDVVRAMLAEALNARVRTVGPLVESLVGRLLDAVAMQGGEVDAIEAFAYPLPIEVIAELLAIPDADRPRFREQSRAVARGMDRFFSGDEARAALSAIGAYFLGLVGERRDAPGDDLVRRLLRAEWHGDRLNELEVVALCTALVFGGHETTVNLLGNGLLALLMDAPALARLRAEPALVGSAVEELLRFDSPPQFVARTATVELHVHGRTIRAGDTVLLGIGAANRDPTVFGEPDRLDLTRSPNPHLAFGLGPHACPGAQLSRIEARLALPAVLHRFPALRLGTAPPARRPTFILRGLERLPVVVG